LFAAELLRQVEILCSPFESHSPYKTLPGTSFGLCFLSGALLASPTNFILSDSKLAFLQRVVLFAAAHQVSLFGCVTTDSSSGIRS
jgi:hypothetical protein